MPTQVIWAETLTDPDSDLFKTASKMVVADLTVLFNEYTLMDICFKSNSAVNECFLQVNGFEEGLIESTTVLFDLFHPADSEDSLDNFKTGYLDAINSTTTNFTTIVPVAYSIEGLVVERLMTKNWTISDEIPTTNNNEMGNNTWDDPSSQLLQELRYILKHTSSTAPCARTC